MKLNKFRPAFKCLYVIPEICGNINSLRILLKRILPLRKHAGQEDIIVFLGNYLLGDFDGPEVIDELIQIKKDYGPRCVCIRGKDEDLFLKAIKGSEKDYINFILNPNGNVLIQSYLKRISSKEEKIINQSRAKELIPNSHLNFLEELQYYYRYQDYCFFWGGINLNQSIIQNSLNNFVADTSTIRIINNLFIAGKTDQIEEFPALKDTICVSSYNLERLTPSIYGKWMGLSIGGPQHLGVIDLETLEMIRIKKDKERPYKLEF